MWPRVGCAFPDGGPSGGDPGLGRPLSHRSPPPLMRPGPPGSPRAMEEGKQPATRRCSPSRQESPSPRFPSLSRGFLLPRVSFVGHFQFFKFCSPYHNGGSWPVQGCQVVSERSHGLGSTKSWDLSTAGRPPMGRCRSFATDGPNEETKATLRKETTTY